MYVLGYGVATTVNLIQTWKLQRDLGVASSALYPAAQKTQFAASAFQHMTKLQKDAVLTEDVGALEQARQEGARIVAGLEETAALPGLGEERSAQARTLARDLASTVTEADRAYRAMIDSKGNMSDQVQTSLRNVTQKIESANTQLDKLVEATSGGLKAELARSAESSIWQGRLSVLVFFGTLIVASLFVRWTIQKSIVRPLNAITAELAESASTLSEASSKLANSSRSLAQSSSGQAASVQEASASCSSVTAMATRNATGAAEAENLMTQSSQNAALVDTSHQQLVEAMTRIGESSEKISRIMKVIDEIAFQTNILALNAAIEAARAGEAGAGFSVVASEVRTLAQRSAQAAKDTSLLIEESVSSSSDGQQRLHTVSQYLVVNRDIANKVSSLISNISGASREQAKGIAQVNKTVTDISSTTQLTASHAEQAASATQELGHQSRSLGRMVERLEAMMG